MVRQIGNQKKTAMHTLVLICYNQEKYVIDALHSVCRQSEVPDEIFILDDHSTDKTMDLISKYLITCPIKIKVIRNKKNLGLWKNVKKARRLGTGTILSLLSGDDLLNKNAIKKINDVVRKEKLTKKQKFMVISDTELLWKNGVRTAWINSKDRSKNLIWARVRNSLSYRGLGLSRMLVNAVEDEYDIEKRLLNVGLFADYVKGFNEVIEVEKYFYVNYRATVYRVDVGVVNSTDRRMLAQQKLSAMRYVKNKYKNYFTPSDFKFFKLLIAYEEIYIVKSKNKQRIKLIVYFLMNIGNFGRNTSIAPIIAVILPNFVYNLLRKLRPHIYYITKLFLSGK